MLLMAWPPDNNWRCMRGEWTSIAHWTGNRNRAIKEEEADCLWGGLPLISGTDLPDMIMLLYYWMYIITILWWWLLKVIKKWSSSIEESTQEKIIGLKVSLQKETACSTPAACSMLRQKEVQTWRNTTNYMNKIISLVNRMPVLKYGHYVEPGTSLRSIATRT